MIHLFSVEKVLTLLAAIYPLIQLKERLQLDSFNVKFSRHFFEMFRLSSTNSTTRFGEISPLWQNFESLWLLFEGLFRIGLNFEPNWSHFSDIGQIFIVVIDTILKR